MKVTFESTGDWALVRTKFWAGDSITDIPKYDDATEINLEEFDYYYANYTGYKRWTATSPLTGQCSEETTQWRTSFVAYAGLCLDCPDVFELSSICSLVWLTRISSTLITCRGRTG